MTCEIFVGVDYKMTMIMIMKPLFSLGNAVSNKNYCDQWEP